MESTSGIAATSIAAYQSTLQLLFFAANKSVFSKSALKFVSVRFSMDTLFEIRILLGMAVMG